MKKDMPSTDSRETPPVSGKTYSTPKLTEFGPVGALTQGGLSGLNEAQAVMNKTRRA